MTPAPAFAMRLCHFVFCTLLFAVSALPAQTAAPFASGPWSGNVTPTSATVAVRLAAPGLQVRVALSERADLAAATYSVPVTTAAESGNVAKVSLTGLKPETDYYYGFEVNGVLRTEPVSRGRLRTFPIGAASFKIAFASCGDYRVADQSAFDAILAEQPLLFIHTGDFHYRDTNSTDVNEYRRNYDSVLNQPNEAALYRGIPIAYMWDDHDACGNDTDGTYIGVPAARRAYDEMVPHYPYGVRQGGEGPIGQAFTIGRVRVIMTDLRTAASPHDAPDNAAKVHLGDVQKAWFEQELIAARDAQFPLIVWVSTVPWIGTAGLGDDDWNVYSTERRELANFIKANGIKNLVLLCGDMHGLAYDDGTHSDYADGGGAPVVVLHGAALTSPGSVKGGPYTAGPFPGSQQYGLLEITDTGGPAVQCRFTGKRVGEGVKCAYSFASTAAVNNNAGYRAIAAAAQTPSAGGGFVNVSAMDRISTADMATIAGFVISGSAPRTVLIRAVGPSLVSMGVTDPVTDPKFTVHQGGTIIAANDNWGDGGAAATLSAVFERVGAFPLASATSKDAAVVLTLNPGVYSAVARSADGSRGRVLVEVYDVP
jgi:alkaline phosphatase D